MSETSLPIPERDVVPLDHIDANVAGLRLLFVNVFGVRNPGGSWTLIDAGLPFTASRIRKWAEDTWSQPPNAILLTHGHFDHVSAAEELSDAWDVPIYAHPLEMPFLTGEEAYPPPDPGVGGGIMAIMSPLYPRGPVNLGNRVRPLEDSPDPEGNISFMPGWHWLHTPGHTVGHVSLFNIAERTLIVGDAFCTVQAESMTAIARMKPELHGPPAYYTPDWIAAKSSVEKLSALGPTTILPGHGQPITGADLPERLEHLAARFDQLAVPAKDQASLHPPAP